MAIPTPSPSAWTVAADLTPSFGSASVSTQNWKQNQAIDALTVPAATGGDGTLSYSATGLPAGVTMSSSRQVSGTPTTAGSGTATVTVSDADGDTDSLTFSWTVAADLTPSFGSASVSTQNWKQNQAIDALTVPAATGGDGTLSYSATGLPAGVTMSSSRQVSGTPTTAGSGTATVTVSDADGDTDSLTFSWTVAADLTPSFGSASVSTQNWKQNQAIDALTVPAATGGDGTLSYSATGLPAGVTMSSSRQVSGTPTAAGSGTATVTVSDADGDTDSLSFAWTVAADLTPSFGSASVSSKSWTKNKTIAAFTVPAATGGDGTLTYSASRLPTGVTMASSRQVSGTPTAAGSGTATVTVRDSDGDTDTLSFGWTVAADLVPTFGSATVPTQSWTVGNEISELAAPVATGGDGSLTYGASSLPDGVQLMKKSDGHVFSGTPSAAGSGTAVLIVKDNDDDADALRFAWTAVADATPDFGDVSVSDKSWTAGEAITAFTLPSATGGDAPVSYGASGLPEGVTVSPSLEVAGTPSETGVGTAILTARDTDGNVDTLSFSWTVASPNASTTGTVLSTTPNPTTGHDFDVAGAYAGSRTYFRLTLLETGPWGHSRVWHPASLPFTQPMTNRVNGAYTYVLAGCYRDTTAILNTAYQVCEQIGDALTVTVAGSETDPVATQLADTYEVRTGHLDDDTLTDLYVRRTSTAAGGGLFQDVILQQAAGGEFTLVAAAPGSANGTKASTEWAVTEAVEVVLNDINLDGFVDVLLRGLDGVVTGASDRMLYAAGRQGGPPSNQKTVDDDLKNFLTEVEAWARNPNFFAEHVTTETVYSHVPTTSCFGIPGTDLDRRNLPSWVITVGVTFSYCISSTAPAFGTREVPTNESPDARGFAEQFQLIDGRIDPGISLGGTSAMNIGMILKSIFGVPYFNGQLEKICTGSFAYDIKSSIACDEPKQVGRIVLAQIDIIRAITCGGENTCPDRNSDGVTQVGEYRILTRSERMIAEANGLNLEEVEDDVNLNGIIDEWERVRIYHRDNSVNGDRWNAARPDSINVPSVKPGQSKEADGVFKEEFTSIDDLGTLLHELMHVLQFEGVVHAIVSGNDPEDYWYRDANGNLEVNADMSRKSFEHFDTQQQAQIIEDRYRLCRGSDTTIDRNSASEVTISEMYDELNSIPGIPEATMECVR